MSTTRRNQPTSKSIEWKEHLYINLELELWDWLYYSKKHKAYYLFSVLFQEAWYLENNLSLVRNAVYKNALNRIPDKRHFDKRDDDNIDIYCIEDRKGQLFIILLFNPVYSERQECLLDIIPVDRIDYQMIQIFPIPDKTIKKASFSLKTRSG